MSCASAERRVSRIGLGVHYVTDVTAGGFLAIGWFCVCWWWVRRGDVTPWER